MPWWGRRIAPPVRRRGTSPTRARARGWSSCRVAGVDREHGAGDVLRRVAEQELDGARHVVDLGETAQRAAPHDLLAGLVVESLRPVGVQETGGDRVHGPAHAPDL